MTAPRGVSEAERLRSSAPVLCAVRAGHAPEPALLAAAAIAATWHAPVHVMTAVEPLGTFAAEADLAGMLAQLEAEEATAAGPRVRAQVMAVAGPEALGEHGTWRVDVLQGPAPRAIAERAHAGHARLVVVGLGRHAVADRLFGSETAVRVARMLDRPLLAVAGPMPVPATRAVVATDFSAASDLAARDAVSLLAPGGTLTLVHVSTQLEQAPPLWTTWTAMRENVLPGLFAEQVRRIGAPDGVHVEWTTRVGDIVTELQDVAHRADASLIAAGRHGLNPLERFFVGSVTTALLRRSDRAVLVATLL
jgi:nucleotide-binding universal stress UspA family protein